MFSVNWCVLILVSECCVVSMIFLVFSMLRKVESLL